MIGFNAFTLWLNISLHLFITSPEGFANYSFYHTFYNSAFSVIECHRQNFDIDIFCSSTSSIYSYTSLSLSGGLE